LKKKITRRELNDWREYYRLYPFDDLHRYHRPAALIARQMGGGEIQPLVEWLQPPAWQEGMSATDVSTLRALGITNRN